MALRLITDSASDVPSEVSRKYNFEVIPTPVVIEGEDYLDGKTIFPGQFYQMLRSGTEVKTYHINEFMFREAFLPYAERGDSLIYICFSTGIAGTFNAANLAKREILSEHPDFDLTIIDSKCASTGFGLIVQLAARMIENGEPKQTVIDAVELHCANMEHILTVETLDYLYKGGRLSRTSAIAGGILDIKPIIEVNDDGALVAIEKVRGRAKSLKRCVDIVGERGVDLKNQTIGLVNGDDRAASDQVKAMLQERFGCTKFMENYVGCAIGAHTGPGIIGITFLSIQSPYGTYI